MMRGYYRFGFLTAFQECLKVWKKLLIGKVIIILSEVLYICTYMLYNIINRFRDEKLVVILQSTCIEWRAT